MKDTQPNQKCHNAECLYAERRNILISMLNVVMLSVIMLSVIKLNVVVPYSDIT
jgi:hypothetical protein